MGLFARSSTLWNRNTLIAAALIIVIGASVWIFLRPTERERAINYHLRKLEDEAAAMAMDMNPPRSLIGFLHWRRIRYTLSQKLSALTGSGTETQDHREALINLGYFTEKRFDLRSANLLTQFHYAVWDADLKEAYWTYYDQNKTSVFVTTVTFEMPKWEQIVSNLNRTASNQH